MSTAEEIEQMAQSLANQIGSEYMTHLQRYMDDESYREECLKQWRAENPNFDEEAAIFGEKLKTEGKEAAFRFRDSKRRKP